MANKKQLPKSFDISVRRRSVKTTDKNDSSLAASQAEESGKGLSTTKSDDDKLLSSPAKKRLSKKAKIIIAVVAGVFVVVAIVATIYFLNKSKPQASRTQTGVKVSQPPAKPPTAPSPLTGVEVDPAAAKQPVVAVVVENLYPSARPQSGLSDAGVVYEALAEGGITRYLALFQDHLAADIGPVRSLRTYFVDWGLEHNAPVAHVGGNADALDLIKPLGMKNLDQFHNGSYFRRINTRAAPHNVYIKSEQMKKLLNDRGFGGPPDFKPWPRKDDTKSQSLTASTIEVNFSGPDYKARFDYDPATNSYTRFIRNAADIDANTKAPIKTKNIIAMYMPTQFGVTRIGESTVVMQTVGSGKAVIFTDGVATEATWKKTDHKARTQFLDANGAEIKLNRGQTWVSVVPVGKSVSYK